MNPLHLLLLVPSALGAFFRYNDDLSCDDVVSEIDVQVHCDGANPSEDNNKCSIYDDAVLTGSVITSSRLPDFACVDMKFCYLGINLPAFCTTYDMEMDTCSEVSMNPLGSEYTSCPSSGRYGFSSTFSIPDQYEDVDGWDKKWGFYGWWMKVYTTVRDCSSAYDLDPMFTCTHTISATRNQKKIDYSADEVDAGVDSKYYSSNVNYYDEADEVEDEAEEDVAEEEVEGDEDDDMYEYAYGALGLASLTMAALAIKRRVATEGDSDAFHEMKEVSADSQA